MTIAGKSTAEVKWMRGKDLAARLSITTMTLHRWKNDPRLGFPAPVEVNGIPRFDVDAVDAWLRSRAVGRLKQKIDEIA